MLFIGNEPLNQKEETMDVENYCGSLVTELGGWKSRMHHVTKKLDKVSSGDKEKVVPMVNELHMILEELDDRVERLRRECPTQWEPDKIGLEGKFQPVNIEWEEVWKNVSPGDIGG
jgi:predicted nuclease with TOPRIM domain